jgi:hypothetical protein
MMQIRTMAAKKQHCTIMLAIATNRYKLPPYGALKCKTTAKEKYYQGIIVWVQEEEG